MKKVTLSLVALGLFFLPLGARTAQAAAQALEYLMTVEIPFEFQVGDTRLPAGEYIIKRDPYAPNLLHVHCPKRKVTAIVSTIQSDELAVPGKASLAFREYGGTRFLVEVRGAKFDRGYVLVKSKTERKLARDARKSAGAKTN